MHFLRPDSAPESESGLAIVGGIRHDQKTDSESDTDSDPNGMRIRSIFEAAAAKEIY